MQTRHRIATAAVGFVLISGPALALAAPGGAAPTPSTSPSAPRAASPTLDAPSASPSALPLPVRTVPGGSSAPVTGAGIEVPAGSVTVADRSSDDTAVIALGAVGALLLAGGTIVAIRRRS